jgi:hypothetical protein
LGIGVTGDSDDTVTSVTLATDVAREEDEIAVSATEVAEAPSFSVPASFSGSEEGSFALAGIGVTTNDSDDTLSATATLSGLPTGWTLYDGAAALTAAGGVATLPTADLGALAILAPDDGGETATLTLTVGSGDGSSTTSASETLVVSASDVAEAPSSSGPTTSSGGEVSVTGATGFSGSEAGSIAPSGIGVTAASNDTVTLAPLTVSGIASAGTVSDTVAHTAIVGSSGARSGGLAAMIGKLGAAQYAQGHLGEAADSFRRALARNPNMAEVENFLGLISRAQARLPEAIEHPAKMLARRDILPPSPPRRSRGARPTSVTDGHQRDRRCD